MSEVPTLSDLANNYEQQEEQTKSVLYRQMGIREFLRRLEADGFRLVKDEDAVVEEDEKEDE